MSGVRCQKEGPVVYVGSETADHGYHDGRLRPAVGVQTVQVLRCNRSHPEEAEGSGWTYNHAPMLCHWNGQFYLEYLSSPISEHVDRGQTLVSRSRDGRNWTKPEVVFPVYTLPAIKRDDCDLLAGSKAIMHQRMGFYVAPDGRLLVMGFYGICPHPTIFPNDGRGLGRVVREIRRDDTLGPIYFLRYNRHAGWDESNTDYPFYKTSEDAGFVKACDALLADKLVTLQMWEEDRAKDGFYAMEPEEDQALKAFCFYHRADGKVVGLWKWQKAALSADDGETWSEVLDTPSVVHSGAKIWGQRTSDGRYALLYNPTLVNNYRWPLALVTGDDGQHFDELLAVCGEVPPRRFASLWDRYKQFGLNYVRGIVEGNGLPPDGDLWLTYSVNKEDIWVSRVPVPVRSTVDDPVDDTFNDVAPGDVVPDWNVYCPKWSSVGVIEFPGAEDRSLELRDEEPYDYVKAERVFPLGRQVTIAFKVLARQADRHGLECEVVDGFGSRPVRLLFGGDGKIHLAGADGARPLAEYEPQTWYEVEFRIDAGLGQFDVLLGGNPAASGVDFAEDVANLERLVFRTGPYRGRVTELPPEINHDLPEADEKVFVAAFCINRVSIDS